MTNIYDDKLRTAEALEKIAGITNTTNIHYDVDKRIAMATEKLAESGMDKKYLDPDVVDNYTVSRNGESFTLLEALNSLLPSGSVPFIHE